MASKMTPISQDVVVTLKARTSEMESSIKSLIQKLQGTNLSDSFTKGSISSLQKVLDKSQELRKIIGSTDSVNSKITTGWSKAYDNLASGLTKAIAKLEGSSINFSDLVGFDNAELKKLTGALDTLKKKREDVYKNAAGRSNLTPLVTVKDKDMLQRNVLSNIGDESKVVNLIDKQIAASKQIATNKQADVDRATKELAIYQRILAIAEQLKTTKLSTTVGKQLRSELGEYGISGTNRAELTQSLSSRIGKDPAKVAEKLTDKVTSAKGSAALALAESNAQIAELLTYKTEALNFIQQLAAEFQAAAQPIAAVESNIEKLKQSLVEKEEANLGKIATDADQIKTEMQGAQRTTEDWTDSLVQLETRQTFFSDMQSKITQIFGLANAFQALRRFVQESWTAIKELDAAFTKIAVVTDFTTGDLWKSFDTYNKMAQQLGVTTTDAIETSALYYQQGLDTAEVMTLTTETIKMARIANMDFATATQAMTSAIRGFKLEMSDAQAITDTYSALAAKAAVDTDQLATAISKTASIAGSAGISLETTSALLTQIIETTQEAPEAAGTALKTIIARFSELKKNPVALKVDVEGEEVSANKVEEALKIANVALRDTEGNFRDLGDVFLELSSKWNSLDRNAQRHIATTAAGSRQQSRFIAMMDNYKRTMELVGIANDSAGAGAIQFAKTLDSVSARVNKLKSNFEALIGNLVENDAVKGFLDLLNKGLQFLVSVSEKGIGTFALFIATISLLIKKMLKTSVGVFQTIAKQWEIHRAEISKDILLKLHLDTTEAEAKLKFLRAQAEALRTGAPAPTYTPPTQTAQTTNSDDFIGPMPLQTNKEINKAVLGTLKSDMAKTVASGMATGLIVGASSGDWKAGLTTGLLSGLFSVLSNPALLKGIGQIVIGGVEGIGGTTIAAALKGIVASAGAALSAAVVPIIIGAAAVGIGVAIYKIFDPVEKAKRAVKQAEKDLAASQAALEKSKATYLIEKDSLKTLSQSIVKYEELNGKLDRTVEEQAELNELTNDLSNQFPQLLHHYNEAGDAVLEQGIQWKEILKTQKEIALNAQKGYGFDLAQSAQDEEDSRQSNYNLTEEEIKQATDGLKESFSYDVYNSYGTFYSDLSDALSQEDFSVKDIPSLAQQYGMSEGHIEILQAEIDQITVLEGRLNGLGKQATLTGQKIDNAFKSNAQTYIDLYNLTAETPIDETLYSSIQNTMGKQIQKGISGIEDNKELAQQKAQEIANTFLLGIQEELDSVDIDTKEISKQMATSTEQQFIDFLDTLNITPTSTPNLYSTLLIQFQTETEGTKDLVRNAVARMMGPVVAGPFVDSEQLSNAKPLTEDILNMFGQDNLKAIAATYGDDTGGAYLEGLVNKVSSGELTEEMARALSKIDISTVPGAQSGYNALLGLDIVDKESAEQAILELAKSISKSDVVNKSTLLSTTALAQSYNNMTKGMNKGAKASYNLRKGYILEQEEVKELLELYPDLQKELGDYANKKAGADIVLADALGKAEARETAASFYSILEENLTILKTGTKGTTDYEEALIRVQNLLNNPKWDAGADNLSLLEDAANGNLTATNTLKEAIRDQFVLSVVGQSDFNKLNTDLLTVASLGQEAFDDLKQIAGFKTVRKMIFPGAQGIAPIYADVLEYDPIDTDSFYTPPPTQPRDSKEKESEYETKVDKYYNEINAIEKLNTELKKLAELREKGNLSPEEYRKNLNQTANYYKNLQSQLHDYNEKLRADRAELETEVANLKLPKAISMKDGKLSTNKAAIDAITSATTREKIDNIITKVDKLNDALKKNSDEWWQVNYALEELADKYLESFINTEDKIRDILIKQDQDEIDATEKKYDKLKEADEDYLKALRDNIDKRRRARDKETDYSDLAKKEKRLALLKRDTSGVYGAEILSLEEEIAQSRRELSDKEVDDMVDSLEEQATERADAYDKELKELQNLQDDKEKSMIEYNKEVDKIMQSGAENVLEWLQTYDEEYLTASGTAQQKYLEGWKNTINEANGYVNNVLNGTVMTSQDAASQKAQGVYSAITATGYGQGATDIQSHDAAGAYEWYNSFIKGREDLSEAVKDLFWQIVILKSQWAGAKVPSFPGYSEGGLVNTTGLAMVHGTTTKPEAFLSAADTKNFQILMELLNKAVGYKGGTQSNIPNTLQIGECQIIVEVGSIADDYNVDQAIDKVKQSIIDNSNYRNVNIVTRKK